jgi:signal transduction histidine kinase
LEKNTKTTERFISEISPELLQKKVQKASFNPLAWIPIIIAGGLVLIANLLFLRADVFQFSFTSLIVQVGLFILSALFIILAWRSLNRNREISRQRIVTLQKEKELSEYKINFINEASKSIDKNIDKLKAISNELSNQEEAKSFIRGVGMLSSVQKSFELLKKFSAFSPTGAIDEDDVNSVLNKILERQSDIMARKNIKIKINVAKELNMRLDKSALILLLGSTINNAVKFSKNNSTIFVTIENKFGGTKISVKDQGIGIPKDKIDQLMMPFTRASDAMQYDYEGLGIGLYLDRIIIEQVGGSIKIGSELGKGTTIEFNVPRAVNKHESEITSSVKPKQSPATT